MIARVWDGTTEAPRGDEYAEYLRRTGVADLEDTEGNHGVYVLRREDGARTGFRMISLWDSMDAIRRFSGPDPEKARYYPEDQGFLLHMSPGVEHYEVVIGPGRNASNAAGALAGELHRVWNGDPWHGPALRQALEGLSAADAARRPIAEAHSIWELVLHVTAWTDTIARRLEGEILEEPEAGDFPAVSTPTSEQWTKTVDRLKRACARLTGRVARLRPAELEATVPGRDHSARFMIHGAVNHLVYHTGQIALLRKMALGSST